MDKNFCSRSTGDGSAQGSLHYFVFDPTYTQTRNILCDVKYVRVSGNLVRFAGICNHDSYPEGLGGDQVGNWFCVVAVDISDPGVGYDRIAVRRPLTETEAADWVNSVKPADFGGVLVNGNIQVH